MLGSTVLELAIGMVFVFLLVSLVCSGISDKISEVLNWRSRDLEKGIRDLLLGGNQELLNKLYNSKLIQSLATAEYKQVSKVLMRVPVAKRLVYQGHSGETMAAKKNAPAPEPFPARYPTNIPARTFVLALFDSFVPNAAGETTVGAFRKTIEEKMADSVVKQQLLALVTGADEKIENARKNVEDWYNAAEYQMTTMYKQHIWWIALIIGFVVSALFNIDSVAIGVTLWRNPELRTAVNAAATQYAQQSTHAGLSDKDKQAASQAALDELNKLNLPIGWEITGGWQALGIPIPRIAPIDWVQTPSAPSFWRWLFDFALKLVGWGITALAGAQGAPFWFDALKKLTAKPAAA